MKRKREQIWTSIRQIAKIRRVTTRTIYKDIAYLKSIGIDIPTHEFTRFGFSNDSDGPSHISLILVKDAQILMTIPKRPSQKGRSFEGFRFRAQDSRVKYVNQET